MNIVRPIQHARWRWNRMQPAQREIFIMGFVTAVLGLIAVVGYVVALAGLL